MKNIETVEARDLLNSSNELYRLLSYDEYFGNGCYGITDLIWDNTEKRLIHSIVNSCHEGGSRSLYKLPYKELTDEILNEAADYKFSIEHDNYVERINKNNSFIHKYNNRKPFQHTGQTVKILNGKHKNKEGVVEWVGKNSYPKYNQEYTNILFNVGIKEHFSLVRIRTNQNESIFVDTSYITVVDGFEPMKEHEMNFDFSKEKWISEIKEKHNSLVYING